MKALNIIALTLLIVGGLNWGLFALFDFDLVAGLFGGPDTVLANIVYCLVAASAVYCAFLMRPFSHIGEHQHHTTMVSR
jgi:uncharacterized membrane protein YuzA (DUF378 family)